MIVWLSASEACGPKFIVPRHRRETTRPRCPTCVYSMGTESTTGRAVPWHTLGEMADRTHQPAPWRDVFRGRDGRLIVGLLLFETLGAVHILIVATVMPAVLRDLGELPLYGWAFAGSALAMIGAIPI